MKRTEAERIDGLTHLGPKSADMLRRAGIDSVAQLRALGSVAAYRRARQVDNGATLNLLWALEGALTARPWREVARSDRLRLLTALDDLERSAAGGRRG